MNSIQSTRPAYRTWAERAVGAAVLDGRVYARVADDSSALPQAAGIVVLAGVSQGLGMGRGGLGVAVGLASVLLGWPLWATMVQVLTAERSAWSGLLRVLGFAHVPALLAVAGSLSAGGLGALVVWVWSLAAATVGVRAALRCGLRKAAMVTVVTWLALMLAATWVGAMVGQAVATREMMEGYP